MKSFFYIVFGGLAVMGIGIGIASLVSNVAPRVAKSAQSINIPKVDFVSSASAYDTITNKVKSVTNPGTTLGTTISGLKRMVKYSASEEEDLLSAANLSATNNPTGNITAKAYVIKNLNVRTVALDEKNSDKILPIASLTKLVTAIVARRMIDPKSHITISKNIISTYGNTASFREGERFLAGNLYYPLLMVSSNDAAEAFARSYGRAKFIQAMNDFVQSIGAYKTYFADPSGLSPSNVSTSNDFVTILAWIKNNDPEILSITKLKMKSVGTHTWTNPTHFLTWSNFAGGKNGYIPESDRTGAALFSMDHGADVYAVVVLGSSARDSDYVKLLGKVKQ